MVAFLSPPNSPDFHRQLVLSLNREFGDWPLTQSAIQGLITDKPGFVSYIGAQPVNANLTAIAAQTTAANQLTYWTGSGAAAQTTLSAFGRTLIDDASASAARTTLSAAYYEQGTWTPTLFGSTTAGTTTYAVQAGEYTLIGNLAVLNGRLNWTATTATGALRLGGVPFPFTATVERRASMIVVFYNGLSLTAGTVLSGGYSLQSSSTIVPTKSSNTTSNNGILITEVPSGEIYFQIIYRIA